MDYTLAQKIEFLDGWLKEVTQYRIEVLGLESMIDDGLSPHQEAAATELLEARQQLLQIASDAASRLRTEIQEALLEVAGV